MNLNHQGTLSEKITKDSIEIKIKKACKKARREGSLDKNGGYIEVDGITNVDDEYAIEYLGRLGFRALYKPVEEQCLGTYSDDCSYPVRHIFELLKIE